MSLGLMKLFAKNSPEGFAIHRLTCAGEILPQRIINECLIAVARLFSPGPEGIDYIIIQVNGDSGLTPGLYHCTPLTLAKIVFLFHILFDGMYIICICQFATSGIAN